MDTPIKLELILQARDGHVSGLLTQSNSPDYTVEIIQEDGDFTLKASNRYTGSNEELDTGLTIEQAVTEAMHAMGSLAHVAFPGFEPVQEG